MTTFASFTELIVFSTAFTDFPKRAALYLNDLESSIGKSALSTGT